MGRGNIPFMKADIHPKYYKTKVECACGAVFAVGSTRENIKVEICSNCHPFYTGKQKTVSSGGPLEKFLKRYKMRTPTNPDEQSDKK